MAETREEARRQFLMALVDAANDRAMAAESERDHLRALVARAIPHIDPDDPDDRGGAWLDQCTAGIILGRDTAPVRCQQHAGHPGDHHCWDDGVCTEWDASWPTTAAASS